MVRIQRLHRQGGRLEASVAPEEKGSLITDLLLHPSRLLTFTLPLGCSSSVTETLSCCSRLFTSLEQQTLTAPCTCDALYSENVLLSITSKRPVPLWMRLTRRLMSIALRLVGPFSPAMMWEGRSGDGHAVVGRVRGGASRTAAG